MQIRRIRICKRPRDGLRKLLCDALSQALSKALRKLITRCDDCLN